MADASPPAAAQIPPDAPNISLAFPPVLTYAVEQKRWERGISWLLAIVCISQLMVLPQAASDWANLLRPIPLPHIPVRLGRAWLPPPPTALEYLREQFDFLFSLTVLPITSLVISAAAFLLLTGMARVRSILFIAAAVQVIVHLVIAVGTISFAFLTDPVSHPYGSLSHPFYQRPSILLSGLSSLDNFVAPAFPVALLTLVLGHTEDPDRRRGWNASAGMIWWVTAIACLLAAIPTIVRFLQNPVLNWFALSRRVFSILFGEGFLTTLAGIGDLCQLAACFAVLPLVLYTCLRGPRGRSMLLIFAILFMMGAVHPMNYLGEILAHGAMWTPSFLSSPSLSTLEPLLSPMKWIAIALAFPLAVRMALSLSAVRARLDGEPQES